MKNACSCSILSTQLDVGTDSLGRRSELLRCAHCGAVLDEKPISLPIETPGTDSCQTTRHSGEFLSAGVEPATREPSRRDSAWPW